MTKSVQPDLERQAAFWDARAAEFPDPREPIQRERLLRRLARLPLDARPGPARHLLDIGAGTGAIALFAAEQGSVVTVLDVSAAMLGRLNEAARARRIALVRADWRDVDQEGAGFSGAFDLVYAQMVPSFRDVTDFARIEACSRAGASSSGGVASGTIRGWKPPSPRMMCRGRCRPASPWPSST